MGDGSRNIADHSDLAQDDLRGAVAANIFNAMRLDGLLTDVDYQDPLTTNGDMLVRLAGVTTRLPVGADGQILTVDSITHMPTWGSTIDGDLDVNGHFATHGSGADIGSGDLTVVAGSVIAGNGVTAQGPAGLSGEVAVITGTNPGVTQLSVQPAPGQGVDVVEVGPGGNLFRVDQFGNAVAVNFKADNEVFAQNTVLSGGSVTNLSGNMTVAGGPATNGNVILAPDGTGIIDATTHPIENVVDPTNAQDAATKNYVDTATAGDANWTNVQGGVGYVNGWGDVGGGEALGGFRKEANGHVFVHGAITGGPGGGEVAFTLPPGYRPAAEEAFVGWTAPGASSVASVFPDGTVHIFTSVVGTIWLALNFWDGQ